MYLKIGARHTFYGLYHVSWRDGLFSLFRFSLVIWYFITLLRWLLPVAD